MHGALVQADIVGKAVNSPGRCVHEPRWGRKRSGHDPVGIDHERVNIIGGVVGRGSIVVVVIAQCVVEKTVIQHVVIRFRGFLNTVTAVLSKDVVRNGKTP